MTREELAKIRERTDKATPGPWHFNGNEIVSVSSPYVGIAGAVSETDCEFIACVREDVMQLLDYINRLENTPLVRTIVVQQREIDRLQAALKEIDKHVDSRLENVNDALRKEHETYDGDSNARKHDRSTRVQRALAQDKGSLKHVQAIVLRALANKEVESNAN